MDKLILFLFFLTVLVIAFTGAVVYNKLQLFIKKQSKIIQRKIDNVLQAVNTKDTAENYLMSQLKSLRFENFNPSRKNEQKSTTK